MFELFAGFFDILRHPVEYLGQPAAFISRGDFDPARKVAATHRFGAIPQRPQRLRRLAHQKPDHGSPQQNARHANHQQQLLRMLEPVQGLFIGVEQNVAQIVAAAQRSELSGRIEIVLVSENDFLRRNCRRCSIGARDIIAE